MLPGYKIVNNKSTITGKHVNTLTIEQKCQILQFKIA